MFDISKIMFDISKIKPESILGPVKTQKFSWCLVISISVIMQIVKIFLCFYWFQAMEREKCVGAIVCKLDMHKKMVRRGYIAMLAIDQDYRRRGIGRWWCEGNCAWGRYQVRGWFINTCIWHSTCTQLWFHFCVLLFIHVPATFFGILINVSLWFYTNCKQAVLVGKKKRHDIKFWK